MCSDIIEGSIGYAGKKIIDKLLSKKNPTLIEVKTVYINGITNTIQFFIYIKKTKFKGKKFIQKLNNFLGIKDYISFNNVYEIRVINNINQEDITNEVIIFDGTNKRIDLKKIKTISGSIFIIEVRGPYTTNLRNLFDYAPNIAPIVNNERVRVYNIGIIIFRSLFAIEEMYLTDIPLEIPFPLDFVSEQLLTRSEIKLNRTIRYHLHELRKYERQYKILT